MEHFEIKLILNLNEVITSLGEGQIAKAIFGGESWQIIKHFGTIRYYENGKIGDCIPLTYSNINASYYIQ